MEGKKASSAPFFEIGATKKPEPATRAGLPARPPHPMRGCRHRSLRRVPARGGLPLDAAAVRSGRLVAVRSRLPSAISRRRAVASRSCLACPKLTGNGRGASARREFDTLVAGFPSRTVVRSKQREISMPAITADTLSLPRLPEPEPESRANRSQCDNGAEGTRGRGLPRRARVRRGRPARPRPVRPHGPDGRGRLRARASRRARRGTRTAASRPSPT